jgi:hypothetical protein
MFSLIRFIVRRLTKNRVAKSKWISRFLLLVAIVRWFTRRLDRPQVVRLRENESASISIHPTGSREL